MSTKRSVCILCVKPDPMWLEFLHKFNHYDVYMVVDDNSVDYKLMYKHYKNINIIQIPNRDCMANGFMKLTYITIYKDVTAWDKALYYFSTINTNYRQIWFIEDDAFFYNEQTLLEIDSKYDNSDLLATQEYKENIDGCTDKWLWHKINMKIPLPYYKCLCCVSRMSHALIAKVKDYAATHKTLDFLEALFPTLCKKSQFIHDKPNELSTAVYATYYETHVIQKQNIYHPIKRVHRHKVIRRYIELFA
jgi:hypothetical protein